MRVHPTAIISDGVRLAEDVKVGPYSVIEGDVQIGEGTEIGPHVVIKGPTTIGRHNRIFQFSSIGEECQDKKYHGEDTRLVIGDHNVIREYCTMQRGTIQDKGLTQVGNHGLYMAYTHVAHDCQVGDHVILANATQCGGHVRIGDYAILGGGSLIHQFCHIGAHAMLGAGTVLLKDHPAFVLSHGNPARPFNMNIEGLKRRGFDAEQLQLVRQSYKVIYRQSLPLTQALVRLKEMDQDGLLQPLIDSLENSSRGIIR